MKIAYFDCSSGISGNMLIGSFIDAGVPVETLKNEILKLPLHGEYELIAERVNKLGISACYFNVELKNSHAHHRHFHEITELILNSGLSSEVKQLSISVFTKLGNAEAKVHNCSIQDIHFHEVGAVDAIIDIVGSAFCITYLGIDKVYASPIHVGKGLVECAHGILPVPAPATAELLKGIDYYEGEIQGELATPTGATIITTMTNYFGPIPDFDIEHIYYGAGSWDLSIPNVLRLCLGKYLGKK